MRGLVGLFDLDHKEVLPGAFLRGDVGEVGDGDRCGGDVSCAGFGGRRGIDELVLEGCRAALEPRRGRVGEDRHGRGGDGVAVRRLIEGVCGGRGFDGDWLAVGVQGFDEGVGAGGIGGVVPKEAFPGVAVALPGTGIVAGGAAGGIEGVADLALGEDGFLGGACGEGEVGDAQEDGAGFFGAVAVDEGIGGAGGGGALVGGVVGDVE